MKKLTQVRGFRLPEGDLERIADYQLRMGRSFSEVVKDCVDVGLPIVNSVAYYELRLSGKTPQAIAELVVKALESARKK